MYRVISRSQCRRIEASSSLLTTLKVLLYILSAVSVIFLFVEIAVIASSLDLSFIYPFILALLVFGVKVVDMVYLYLVAFGSRTHKPNANVVLSVSLVVIGLTDIVVIVETLALSGNIVAVLTNFFVLYYTFLLAVDVIAIIYNNSAELRFLRPYLVIPDEDGCARVVEMYHLSKELYEN